MDPSASSGSNQDQKSSRTRNQDPIHHQSMPITHGYLHGHIHKHRDHTHIHGHIHNHDHEHDHKQDRFNNPSQAQNQSHAHEFAPSHLCQTANDPEAADPIILADSIEACNAFTDYCKDIFCENLEDCFYENCPDESTSFESRLPFLHIESSTQPTQLPHEAPPAIDHLTNAYQVLPGSLGRQDASPFPKTDSLSHCHASTAPTTVPHRNSLCNTQLEKRPIFENLIRNLSYIKPNGGIGDSLEDAVASEAKRQKMERSDFEIHFPHQCHQINPLQSDVESHQITENLFNDSVETIGSQRHNLHQSCFHTTIPNLSLTYDNASTTNNAMHAEPDFDFFIQFNNLSRSMGMQPCCGDTATLSLEAPPILHAPGIAPGIPESERRDNLSPPYQYNCQWDHCNHSVDDDTFLKHLMGLHIESQADQKQPIDASSSVDPKRTFYLCEWNNCDFFDNDFNSLLDHLQVHKNQPKQSSSVTSHPENQNCCPHHHQPSAYALTPTSTIKSSASSPISQRSFSQQHQALDNVNILSMEIVPKNNTSRDLNATFTADAEPLNIPSQTALQCQWAVGVLPNGDHQVCGMNFTSAEELQQHLINDHVGSGKSSYSCCWVGCDRHNGKTFTQRQKVYRHIHVHTNYKPCTCPTCGANFAVESTLRQHMRVHLGEKPFVCSICDKTFSTSSSLSIHYRVHTGEKPLECKWPGCKKRFSESSNLTKHMRTHCKMFRCDTCGEEFDRKAQYSKHMKDHADEKVGSDTSDFKLATKRKLCTAT